MIAQSFCEFFFAYPDQALLIGMIALLCMLPLSRVAVTQIVSWTLLATIIAVLLGPSTALPHTKNLYMGFVACLGILDWFMWYSLAGPFHTEKKLFVLFWAIAGHLLIVQHNWLSLYLGLEIVTIPFYALTALSSHPDALEGALKYFTVNACLSVLWLFSLTLVWTGAQGFAYSGVDLAGVEGSLFIMMSCLLISMKMGAFPCAYWAPDLYQVSSRSTIVWISFVPKYLVIVLCSRLLEVFVLSPALRDALLAGVVIGTLWGHFGALYQSNIQRFLGYTAAAQVGFFLAPLFIRGVDGLDSALLYLVIYTLSMLTFVYGLQRSFLENVLMIVRSPGKNGLYPIAYFSGLLSLAGFPPFPGFFAKLYVFMTVIQGHKHMGLVVFLGLSSLIALYYYIDWIFKTRSNFVESGH